VKTKDLQIGGLYKISDRIIRVVSLKDNLVFWEHVSGKPVRGRTTGKFVVKALIQRAAPYHEKPKPESAIPIVQNPEDVVISRFDIRQLKMLADNAMDIVSTFGTSSDAVKHACAQAFRLGFTARSRGEAVQEHPPAPDWQKAS